MVQRYEYVTIPVHGGWTETGEMQKTEDGDYVLYSDYAKLEARVKELEAESKANREAYEYAWNAYQDLAKISLEDAWIPVEEALPEKNGLYQILDNGWGTAQFKDGIWRGEECVKSGSPYLKSTFREIIEPTHWKRIVLP